MRFRVDEDVAELVLRECRCLLMLSKDVADEDDGLDDDLTDCDRRLAELDPELKLVVFALLLLLLFLSLFSRSRSFSLLLLLSSSRFRLSLSLDGLRDRYVLGAA